MANQYTLDTFGLSQKNTTELTAIFHFIEAHRSLLFLCDVVSPVAHNSKGTTASRPLTTIPIRES